MMVERGLQVDRSTIARWEVDYAGELEQRIRPYLKPSNASWRVDDTYIKGKEQWMCLYWAIDSQGNSLNFHLSPTRDALAAERFFRKVLGATHTIEPRVINVVKNAAYPCAFATLKQEQTLPTGCQLRQVRYLNN